MAPRSLRLGAWQFGLVEHQLTQQAIGSCRSWLTRLMMRGAVAPDYRGISPEALPVVKI